MARQREGELAVCPVGGQKTAAEECLSISMVLRPGAGSSGSGLLLQDFGT